MSTYDEVSAQMARAARPTEPLNRFGSDKAWRCVCGCGAWPAGGFDKNLTDDAAVQLGERLGVLVGAYNQDGTRAGILSGPSCLGRLNRWRAGQNLPPLRIDKPAKAPAEQPRMLPIGPDGEYRVPQHREVRSHCSTCHVVLTTRQGRAGDDQPWAPDVAHLLLVAGWQKNAAGRDFCSRRCLGMAPAHAAAPTLDTIPRELPADVKVAPRGRRG